MQLLKYVYIFIFEYLQKKWVEECFYGYKFPVKQYSSIKNIHIYIYPDIIVFIINLT